MYWYLHPYPVILKYSSSLHSLYNQVAAKQLVQVEIYAKRQVVSYGMIVMYMFGKCNTGTKDSDCRDQNGTGINIICFLCSHFETVVPCET